MTVFHGSHSTSWLGVLRQFAIILFGLLYSNRYMNTVRIFSFVNHGASNKCGHGKIELVIPMVDF